MDVDLKVVSHAPVKGEVYPNIWGENMKSRTKQRENRKLKKAEELLNKRNEFNVKDLTAYNAVLQIKTNGKAASVL